MNIALIGFGHVGKAFFKLIQERKYRSKVQELSLDIKYVLRKDRGAAVEKENEQTYMNAAESAKEDFGLRFGKEINFDYIMNRGDVDLVVEVTPSNIENGEPAASYIRKALSRGISVVSGSKGAALLHYHELAAMAAVNGASFDIGCALGGALPLWDALRFCTAGARITKIEGILNGTSNFILTEMRRGLSYDAALARAASAGIAETNPQADVSGLDTAVKILIAANYAFSTNKKIADTSIQGIKDYNMNKLKPDAKIKLIGRAVKTPNGEIQLSVSREEITNEHPLYYVDGVNKGAVLTTDILGEIVISGGASSPANAAAALLRDIVNRYRKLL